MFPFVYDYTVFKYRLGVSAEPSGGDANLGSRHFIYNLKEPESFDVCFYTVIIAVHTTLPPREAVFTAVRCSIKSSPRNLKAQYKGGLCVHQGRLGLAGRAGRRGNQGPPGPPGMPTLYLWKNTAEEWAAFQVNLTSAPHPHPSPIR